MRHVIAIGALLVLAGCVTDGRYPTQSQLAMAALDHQSEAQSMASNLIQGTGGVAYMLNRQQAPDILKGYPAAWTTGSVAGALQINYDNRTLSQYAQAVTAGDASGCPGKFLTNKEPLAGGFGMRVTNACDMNGTPMLIVYTLMPRRAGGLYAVLNYSTVDVDAAMQLDQAMAATLAKLAGF